MTTTLPLTRRPTLTSSLTRAWRRRRDRPRALLPIGPDPWPDPHGPDRDRERVLSDLRAVAARTPWA